MDNNKNNMKSKSQQHLGESISDAAGGGGGGGGGGGSFKVRFDAMDVMAMVAHLNRTLLGRRVVNIYSGDENGETFIFKLEKGRGSTPVSATAALPLQNNETNSPENATLSSSSSSKDFLLMESGIRFHTLQHFRSDNPHSMPSPFVAKLRKHIRGLRLEQIHQLGDHDRVVLFQFGVGSNKHAIILELYAKGNFILTDHQYSILALLRSHVYSDKDNVAVKVGQIYPVTYATSWKSGLETIDDSSESSNGILSIQSAEHLMPWVKKQLEHYNYQPSSIVTDDGRNKNKKSTKGNQLTLKTLLLKPSSGASHYGPALLEHCILQAQLRPHQSLQECILTADDWLRLQSCLQTEGPAIMNALQNTDSSVAAPGYILYRPLYTTKDDNEVDENSNAANVNDNSKPPVASNVDLPHGDKILLEFLPHLLKQHEDRLYLTFPNFSSAVDDFFAQLVTQKRMLRAQAAEAAAVEKLEKVRQDQLDRVAVLDRSQESLKEQARAVQLHAENVDKALTVINSALDSGMDWDQLELLVEVERNQNHNPIALLIHLLDLEHDSMILRLPSALFQEDGSTIDVSVTLHETAHANASQLFAKYRAAKEKSQKTIEASTKALKAAEETAKRQLAEAQKRAQFKGMITSVHRKPTWFEKFHWFITSDNYLVLGGRDAHQNELLVKRYMRAGDAYLHADVHGASSCILRAKRRRLPNGRSVPVSLSEQALREAGSFTICWSNAWSRRMVMSAWWVESHQVSKTAPTGEYLTVGSFMVRGKKNYLPPGQLEMGLAVLFRLGDDVSSMERHKNERRDFALMQYENIEWNEGRMDDDHHTIDNHGDDLVDNVKSRVEPAQKYELREVMEGSAPIDENPENDQGFMARSSISSSSNAPDAPFGDSHGEENEGSDDGDGRSGFTDSDHEPNNSQEADADNALQKNRGISAKQRKLIKKYGSLEAANRVLAEREREIDNGKGNGNDESTMMPGSLATSMDTNGQRKRGQKAKLKRMKMKYADQDEDDRELAMQALQGGEKAKKKDSKAKKRQPKETAAQQLVAADTAALLIKDPAKVADTLPDSVRSILIVCLNKQGTLETSFGGSRDIDWSGFDAGTLEQLKDLKSDDAQVAAATKLLHLIQTSTVDNLTASLGGIIRTIRKYGHRPIEGGSVKANNGKGNMERELEAIADEHVIGNEEEEDVGDDTLELNKLTGKPHPEDLILYATPVCAPYHTLAQYTYRVKLTPGNMKRGKAAKQCLEMLLKEATAKSTPSQLRQKDLIRKIPENDWVQVILADVKISAAGASKLVKGQKAAGKKSQNN